MSVDWESAMVRCNEAQLRVFGEDVLWTHVGGSAATISVIVMSLPMLEESVNPNYLYLWTMLAQAPAIARGDTIVRNSTTYTVLDCDPSEGGIRLTLEQ